MAHVPDGFLSPTVLVGTAAASAAFLSIAARRSRVSLGEREAPLLGAATAFVFAAQMLSFPLGAGTSAHLLGGTLLAVVVGPWSGMLVMFAVVLVQGLLFQDGGIAALGANTLNLAVLSVGAGWILFRWAYTLTGGGRRRLLMAAAFAAYGSTALVGAAVAVELAWSGLVPVGPALIVVGGGHAVVGVAEACLTLAILALVARSRPELLAPAAPDQPRRRTAAWVAAAVALGLASAAAYFGSARPDALEAAAARLGLGAGRATFRAPLADYTAPIGGPWVAAALGLVILFGVVCAGVTLLLVRRRP